MNFHLDLKYSRGWLATLGLLLGRDLSEDKGPEKLLEVSVPGACGSFARIPGGLGGRWWLPGELEADRTLPTAPLGPERATSRHLPLSLGALQNN